MRDEQERAQGSSDMADIIERLQGSLAWRTGGQVYGGSAGSGRPQPEARRDEQAVTSDMVDIIERLQRQCAVLCGLLAAIRELGDALYGDEPADPSEVETPPPPGCIDRVQYHLHVLGRTVEGLAHQVGRLRRLV